MKFVIYRDRKKEWRWRIVAKNGKVIADSAEGYKRRGHAYKMAWKLATNTFEVTDE